MNLPKKLLNCLQWLIICVAIGVLSGAASAFFLIALNWVTQIRENHLWLIWFLPLGGLLIGLLYYYYGTSVVKGNNLLLEEYENPQKTIPFRMAPLVLLGTLITHLFGGSAGREGTAVQMGGAIADQFSLFFQLDKNERKTLLILGISAGFASVFGTPLAGALFALEVVYFSKINLKSVILSFLVAYTAYFSVGFWPIEHTHYTISFVPKIDGIKLLWTFCVGILFGWVAFLFSKNVHFWSRFFAKTIAFPPFRPLVGGLVLALVVHFFHMHKFIGLGVPEIVRAFTTANSATDFLLKLLFTGFTLGAGFKGGEVTPLFFVGATLGSALSLFVPLPIGLLAGMGFVAVFAGATHTPIACSVMGMELFGIQAGFYISLVCFLSYLTSGSVGIYQSQKVKGLKYLLYQKIRRLRIVSFLKM